ncbi:MAG: glycosyltransferase [Flavobacteriales bacterium TMED288]|nr:hypothetical protein [Flavobacteriales bacterium]RPG52760.1 MAG: glycosyltransferase [Flavobacteriales bacterium TMED288]|tara:strand:- start:187 stop:1377 length:1191 start_codon:yes stop_codon:yes gene_type:complete
MDKKNILILSNKPAYPKNDGGSFAISQMLEILLELNHNVTFVCIETNKHPSFKNISKNNLTYKSFFIDTKIKINKLITTLLNRKSYIIQRFFDENFKNFLEDILSKNSFDLILFESLYCSLYLKYILKLSKAKIIYRCHNIEHKIWFHEKKLNYNIFQKIYLNFEYEFLKKFELKFWNKVDIICSISNKDRDYIISKTKTKVKLVSVFFSESNQNNEDYNEKKMSTIIKFFHIGSMDWRPNLSGIRWFLEKIWKKFILKNKKSEFHIGGKSMPKKIINLEYANYYNHSFINKIETFMKKYDVMIVPIKSGSGIRIKIIQAMTLKKCIISTSIGAEGIDYTHRKNIIIANTHDQFYNEMIYCVKNPGKIKEIGENAYLLSKKYFSKKNIVNQIKTIF